MSDTERPGTYGKKRCKPRNVDDSARNRKPKGRPKRKIWRCNQYTLKNKKTRIKDKAIEIKPNES